MLKQNVVIVSVTIYSLLILVCLLNQVIFDISDISVPSSSN